MDRQSLALLIPIMALSIPVIALIFHGLRSLARLRLEEARARGGDDGRVEAMARELEAVREELLETQERLDFVERVLARQKEPGQLPE